MIEDRTTEEMQEAERPERPRIDLDLQTVIKVAAAAQHIQDLEDLRNHQTCIGGELHYTRRAIKPVAHLVCDPRRIIALMLYAADHPDWAWVNFWTAFCPDMSVRQMAALRGISRSTVQYYQKAASLPQDAYDFIPENR